LFCKVVCCLQRREKNKAEVRAGRGFTLAELLIAIVIILIVAALAVPNLLHSRLAANEAAAVSDIQSINRAEVGYQTAYPTHGFATRLSDLGGSKPCSPNPASACLIDQLLTGGLKNGYTFAAVGSRRAANGIYMDYAAGAAPAQYGKTGVRLFCSTSDGVLRYSANPQHTTVPPDWSECKAEADLE
jgi:type IV pilus assembly protein PilA